MGKGLPLMRTTGAPMAFAPAAMGMPNTVRRSRMFNGTNFTSSDRLANVSLGTTTDAIVYRFPLAPQDFPSGTRVRREAKNYANYRAKNVCFKIRSAIGSDAGGQYAVFYDPNPDTVWTGSAAVNSLSSMPAQAIMSSWQNTDLVIIGEELHLKGEFFTSTSSTETLKTHFGQLVLVCMVPANTSPAGGGSVTVWADVEWRFYNPNTTMEDSVNVAYNIPAGEWIIVATDVALPAATTPLPIKTAFQVFPELPNTFLAGPTAGVWLARYTDVHYHFFSTSAEAYTWSQTGTGTPLAAGSVASQTQPVTAAVSYFPA